MRPNRLSAQIILCENDHDLAEKAAQEILLLSQKAIQTTGRFNIALSGGGTPKPLYLKMAERPYREQFAWHQMHFFWTDERWVPPQHKRSNYRIAAESLLTRVDIPFENIHPMKTGEGDPKDSAASYEKEILSHFGTKEEIPRFDLVLLGAGLDGHTASLFPEEPVIFEKKRLVASLFSNEMEEFRITFTLPLINHAQHIFFLVTGREKAPILAQLLEGDKTENLLPAQRVMSAQGAPSWFVDKSAAALLKLI